MSKKEVSIKPRVVNKTFQDQVKKELANYINSETAFRSSHDSMQKISQWLEESHS